MTDQDDRDLSAPFEELRAPRSTANYVDRVPSVEALDTVYPRRWPQALATVLAVLVALGGAGTFLALRNARQGGLGSSAGYPSARSEAAMAFDSTSGLTVMYGGSAASGATLSDTWTWNGSSWTMSTGPSPGKLLVARMSDDPPDRGVLLTGLPQPASQGSGIACVGGSGTGSVGPATGSVAPDTAVASPPVPSASATTACPTPAATPSLQTWLFGAKGWTRLAGSTSAAFNADTPYSGSQLAYDAGSGEVIAVSTAVMSACGAPLRSGAPIQPDHICPLPATGQPAKAQNGSSGAACSPTVCSSIPCRLGGAPSDNCLPFSGSMLTWTWAHGQWTQRRGAILPGASSGVVFGDAAGPHATVVTETTIIDSCLAPAPCPAEASTTQTTTAYVWAGSAWSQSANSGGVTKFSLAGAAVASVGDHAIALSQAGQLYSWSATDPVWALQTAATQPNGRSGASMAEGPSGSIVLFGGVSVSTKPGSLAIGGQAPGSDTWTWNGSSWRQVAGTSPPAVTTPSPCSDVTGLGSNTCARPPSFAPAVTAPSSGVPRMTNPIGA
jgi:hypothetical protein